MPRLIEFDNSKTVLDMEDLLEYERDNYVASRKAGYQFDDLAVERTGIMLLVNCIKQMKIEELETEYEK